MRYKARVRLLQSPPRILSIGRRESQSTTPTRHETVVLVQILHLTTIMTPAPSPRAQLGQKSWPVGLNGLVTTSLASDSRQQEQQQQRKNNRKNPWASSWVPSGSKSKSFFVGGINPECTREDIKNFCQLHCQVIECRMIPSRMYGTQSARLVVAESDGQLLGTFSWPAYCYIRPWKFQKPSQAPMGTPEFTATPQLLTSQPCSSQAGAESS